MDLTRRYGILKLDVINCRRCGTLFKKNKRTICDRCVEIEKEQMRTISKFVESSSELVTLRQISEQTGISFDDVDEIYKGGQLLTYTTNRIVVKCGICNQEKKGSEMKGYFCEKCYEKMAEENGLGIKDPEKIEITLKKFDRDVMHTRKSSAAQEASRFGRRSRRDRY